MTSRSLVRSPRTVRKAAASSISPNASFCKSVAILQQEHPSVTLSGGHCNVARKMVQSVMIVRTTSFDSHSSFSKSREISSNSSSMHHATRFYVRCPEVDSRT